MEQPKLVDLFVTLPCDGDGPSVRAVPVALASTGHTGFVYGGLKRDLQENSIISINTGESAYHTYIRRSSTAVTGSLSRGTSISPAQAATLPSAVNASSTALLPSPCTDPISISRANRPRASRASAKHGTVHGGGGKPMVTAVVPRASPRSAETYTLPVGFPSLPKVHGRIVPVDLAPTASQTAQERKKGTPAPLDDIHLPELSRFAADAPPQAPFSCPPGPVIAAVAKAADGKHFSPSPSSFGGGARGARARTRSAVLGQGEASEDGPPVPMSGGKDSARGRSGLLRRFLGACGLGPCLASGNIRADGDEESSCGRAGSENRFVIIPTATDPGRAMHGRVRAARSLDAPSSLSYTRGAKDAGPAAGGWPVKLNELQPLGPTVTLAGIKTYGGGAAGSSKDAMGSPAGSTATGTGTTIATGTATDSMAGTLALSKHASSRMSLVSSSLVRTPSKSVAFSVPDKSPATTNSSLALAPLSPLNPLAAPHRAAQGLNTAPSHALASAPAPSSSGSSQATARAAVSAVEAGPSGPGYSMPVSPVIAGRDGASTPFLVLRSPADMSAASLTRFSVGVDRIA